MYDSMPPVDQRDYWDILKSLLPIMLVGALSGFAYGLKRILLEQTVGDKVVALLLATVPSGVVSCVFILLLPFVFGHEFSPEVQLGLAGVCGGMGTKGFDLLMKRFYNLVVVENHRVTSGSARPAPQEGQDSTSTSRM